METAALFGDYNYLVRCSALVVVILWLCWSVLDWAWFRPKKLERELRSQGLAGNSYRFLVGDMIEYGKMAKEASTTVINLSDDIVPYVMPFLHKSTIIHGKRSFMWIGPTPSVNIMDHELVKEMLRHTSQFTNPKANPIMELLATGLASYDGEKWTLHRRIITTAFHPEKLKNMFRAFHLSCSEMMKKWEKIIPRKGGSSELDVWPYIEALTGDVISRTAFGSSYEEGCRIFQLQREQASLAMNALKLSFIPGYRFFPTKMNIRMRKIDREVRSSLRRIISKKIAVMKKKSGQAKTEDDLLGMLLESSNNDEIATLSIEDVIEECRLLYMAGQETIACLLVWTMILLSKHKDWQQRAREEVLEVFGDREPDFHSLSHLKIVTMILYEVLRLYPPGPQFARIVHKRTKLGKGYVPAGINLIVNTIFIHRDKETWGDDALEFKPERFAEGVSKATNNQASMFLPFGFGHRVCVGQNFAMLEAKLAMAMILKRFSFDLSPSYTHAPSAFITLHPQHGAHLILHSL